MIFTALSDGRFLLGDRTLRCALGRSGVIEAAAKREGDGMSPLGTFALRRLLFRPDRGTVATSLPAAPIEPLDGWCDDPGDPRYNRPVGLPYPASAERLWREDGVYDLVVVLGHNDTPPVPGLGSAIFLHLARPAYEPTEGCVALARPDLEAVLQRAGPGDFLRIERA
jgi:L,D-peptidoglycan transpeptidase YkuD (ErfK/YbiS/YcfS/YnhG family)